MAFVDSDVPQPSRTERSTARVPSALPALSLRIGAVVAIVVAGICGALIGYAFADLQCVDSCGTWRGLGTLAGAATAAIGVTIVVVLALRAMDEWQTIQKRDSEKRETDRRNGKAPDDGTGSNG